MDPTDSPAEADFRTAVRGWLTTAIKEVAHWAPEDDSPAGISRRRAWQRRLFDGGWAGLTWAQEFGGQGLSPGFEAILEAELARCGRVDNLFRPAIGDAARLIMSGGSPAQARRYLGPILRGEAVWCHLLSEPGAGSDLAGLSTRAVAEGGYFVVNGQKVWTSYAHVADYGLLLARTDPALAKHRGLTYFILDMHAPGVTVRPLRQITGESHFNEVFFDDVRIPAADVIGEVNGGWSVARASMTNERAYIGARATADPIYPRLLELAQRLGIADEPLTRQRLAHCFTRESVLRFLQLRTQTNLSLGRPLGSETSMLKLAFGRHKVQTADDAMTFLGRSGLAHDQDEPQLDRWLRDYLDSPRSTIGGGTEQMQKNAIGERLLGLPREVNGDEHLPWKDITRR
jgi:alkylation response protein AidB-like acyl-CoA dehydrogenase